MLPGERVCLSRYDWERGTITLPTAAVTAVKKAVREASNREHDRVYEAARTWWRAHGAAYARAVARVEELRPAGNSAALTRVWKRQQEIADTLPGDEATHEAIETGVRARRMPRREDVHPARATNKTDTFAAGRYAGECHISFKGREVTWAVSENNHAREAAHEGAVAQAFFTALARVKWTRGTGGVIVGNDEYNRDADYAGGGANYITATYGPKGEEARAGEMGVTVQKYRKIVGRDRTSHAAVRW